MRKLLFSVVCIFCFSTFANATDIQQISVMSGKSKSRIAILFDGNAPEYLYSDKDGQLKFVFPASSISKGNLDITPDGDQHISGIHAYSMKKNAYVDISVGDSKYAINTSGGRVLIDVAGAKTKSSHAAPKISSIDVNDKGTYSVLSLLGEHLNAPIHAFLTNDSRSLVIDMPNGKNISGHDHINFASANVESINVGATDKNVRFVVNMVKHSDISYSIKKSDNRIDVTFGRHRLKAKNNMIVENVSFKADDRVAHITVRTNKINPFIHLEEHGKVYILEVKNSVPVKSQIHTMDVSDFPGPVNSITTSIHHHDTKIKVRLRESSIARTFQSGNIITLLFEPKDMIRISDANHGVPVYSGERVTLKGSNMDIRDALKVIAATSNLNMVISDKVSGTIDMRLVDVPWDQALDTILIEHNLAKEVVGNVMRIAPYDKIKQDIQRREQSKVDREAIEPLETEFIHLSYANIDDINSILNGKKSGKTTPARQGSSKSSAAGSTATVSSANLASNNSIKLLSSRGDILMDKRTNTMVITDTRERLNNIKRLIAVLDRPTQQVMIEAHIVEASDSFAHDLGVRWGGSINRTTSNYTHHITGNPRTGNVVDLGAAVGPGAGGLIGYTLGTISGSFNINLELSAAESDGSINVISDPQILASNLKQAKIEQITDIPFTQTTFAGGVATTSTISKQAKLTLDVKPQITSDGSVIMDLVINKDTPIVNTLSANGQPIIDRKNVTTTLRVKSGDIIVIGGIKSTTIGRNINGVPGLKDVPLLGGLFRRKQHSSKKNNLLIFIRPTIVDEGNNLLKRKTLGSIKIDTKQD